MASPSGTTTDASARRGPGRMSPRLTWLKWEWGIGSTFAGIATWNAVNAPAFTSPITGTTVAALDGDADGNRVANINATVNTTVAAGSTLWIRYIESNDIGNDHGPAVDNFQFSGVAVPEPSSLALVGIGPVFGIYYRGRLRRQSIAA